MKLIKGSPVELFFSQSRFPRPSRNSFFPHFLPLISKRRNAELELLRNGTSAKDLRETFLEYEKMQETQLMNFDGWKPDFHTQPRVR